MLDALASEYGWTHDYILHNLTKDQVTLYIEAIGRRIDRKNKAMETAMNESGSPSSPAASGEDSTVNIDEVISKGRFGAFSDMHFVLEGMKNGSG